MLEQLDAPGGRAYVFRQDGFSFDAGPTLITAPFLLEELWRLCNRRLEDDVVLKFLQPFYRIRFADGGVIDCSDDEAAMAAQFVKHPRLRFALSFHPLFVGGNPFTTTSIYGLIASSSAAGACTLRSAAPVASSMASPA